MLLVSPLFYLVLSLFIHLFDLILEKESYCCVSLFSIPIIPVSLLFYLVLSLFIHLFDLVLENWYQH